MIERMYDQRVFEALAVEVRGLRVPLDGPALLELLAIRDRLNAQICDTVDGFDHAKLWDLDAATSMHAWLRDRAGMTVRQAGREVARARSLHDLPLTREAWKAGTLSGGQVDAVTAIVPARHRGLFVDHEAGLLASLAALTLEDAARALNHWVALADAVAADDAPVSEPRRSLHLSPLLDGWGRIDGHLDSETFALVSKMIEVAETPDGDGDPVRTPGERRHDGLGDGARFVLDHHTDAAAGRNRAHLNVILDVESGTARYT